MLKRQPATGYHSNESIGYSSYDDSSSDDSSSNPFADVDSADAGLNDLLPSFSPITVRRKNSKIYSNVFVPIAPQQTPAFLAAVAQQKGLLKHVSLRDPNSNKDEQRSDGYSAPDLSV